MITSEENEKMLEVIEKEGNDDIEFNNGFVIAIALFLQHKDMLSQTVKDDKGNVIRDLRLYAAADHLFEMETPGNISKDLKKRISMWRSEIFHYRMESFKDTIITDKLFEEGENILAKIDEEIFNIKKVKMKHR